MQRRDFITLLGSAAAAWPVAARAQQPAMPVIGYLYTGSPEAGAPLVAAFRKGLSESGFVEGGNVAIEYRWANNDTNRLPELAADLVRRRVAVIATPGGGTVTALAAKAATTTIPIIFTTAGDPVQAGIVASLNRPGGNITGLVFMNVELMPKRLGLLHELLPGAARFAVLLNPNNPVAQFITTDTQAAAAAVGRQIEVLTASTSSDIDTAFASLVQKRADVLLVSPDPFFGTRRVQIVTLAAHHRVPAIYYDRPYSEIGGLMSYGTNLPDQIRQVGVYTGRILKGEKPADLPVFQVTKLEFVINLRTAKALSFIIPPGLLAIADEVIE